MALRPRRRCRPCRPPPSCFFFQSSPASSTSGKTRLHLMAFFSSSSVVHTQFAQTSTKHIPSVMPPAARYALKTVATRRPLPLLCVASALLLPLQPPPCRRPKARGRHGSITSTHWSNCFYSYHYSLQST